MASVVLDMPQGLYERVQQVANHNQQPLEAVLLASLDLFFATPPDRSTLSQELERLSHYSDEQLWEAARRPLPWSQALRLKQLDTTRPLSPSEADELEELLQVVDQYMLLRSEALLQLHQRGHDVQSYVHAAP